mmetsp:Transcript_1955/g.8609  ORF Transcript_1955/g.8609 Transcript_1955/m.8609 type:complete len:174 (-) Transcript_1955:69-590(-)
MLATRASAFNAASAASALAAAASSLAALASALISSSASSNMYANRRFLRSNELARKVLSYLPKELGYTHVLSDMRFIEYPPGGHILPHVDGVRRDQETSSGAESTTSFLLFTEEIPEGEGGETEFLESVDDDAKVLFGARPNRGSILLFPHGVAHRGNCVGCWPKVLLRGDLY